MKKNSTIIAAMTIVLALATSVNANAQNPNYRQIQRMGPDHHN